MEAKTLGKTASESSQLTAFEQQYAEILKLRFEANPLKPIPEYLPQPRDRPKQSPAKNLLDRLESQRST